MSKTTFNKAGFIQPAFVEKMLMSNDADGFNDRQLFAFSPQRDVKLNDLKLPIPPNVPSLREIYTLIRMVHKSPREYTMDDNAMTAFQCYHDNLVRRQSRQVNENIQGIFFKTCGYVARLSMVLFVLEQALTSVLEGENPDLQCMVWSTTYTEDRVNASASIMDYLIKRKLIMMDTEEIGPSYTTSPGQMVHIADGDRLRRLLTLIADDEGHISPSKVSQKHICAPTDGKHSVSKAIELFSTAENLGFGETIEQTSTNRSAEIQEGSL